MTLRELPEWEQHCLFPYPPFGEGAARPRGAHDGEILRLIRLLNAALPHVSAPDLRRRIEDLLSSVTDGRMPMFEKPETDLDRALGTLRSRREEAARDDEPAAGETEA